MLRSNHDNFHAMLGHFCGTKTSGDIQSVSVAKEINILDQTSGHFPTMSVASKQIRPFLKLFLWQQNKLEHLKMFLMRRRDTFEPRKWQQNQYF